MNFVNQVRAKINNYNSISLTSQNLKQKEELLKDIKICTLQFQSLPPSNLKPNKDEYKTFLETIELEMILSLEKQDENAFNLAYQQAKYLYFDCTDILPNKSEKYLYFVGLYLLYLLSNNKTTEFSTEIELIDIKDRSSEYINISLEIERCIMEGNYKKLSSLKNSNDKYFNYFLNKFDDTIRFQIARSIERSYDSLKLEDAAKLLMLNQQNELTNFIKNQNESEVNQGINWQISGDRIEFLNMNQTKETIPALRIMQDVLFLGVETEKII